MAFSFLELVYHSNQNLYCRPTENISGSLMGSLAKGFLRTILRKFCGKSAEICKNLFVLCQKCGNSAESLRKFCRMFQTNFCNDPFPNVPISGNSYLCRRQIPPSFGLVICRQESQCLPTSLAKSPVGLTDLKSKRFLECRSFVVLPTSNSGEFVW